MKPYIIGITGASASGKTYLLNTLLRDFSRQELCLISQDNYYRDANHHVKDENGQINFDLPDCIDFQKFFADFKKLKRGKQVEQKEYLFQLEGVEPKKIILEPAPIIIIEGLFIFHFKDLYDHLNLKIFVDAHEDTKLKRRILRDTTERGIPVEQVVYQWENHVRPAYEKFLLPYKDGADIIINNNNHINEGIRILENHMRILLKKVIVPEEQF